MGRRGGIKGVEEVEGKRCDGGVWEGRFGLVSLCCVKGVWSLGSVGVIMRVGEGGGGCGGRCRGGVG